MKRVALAVAVLAIVHVAVDSGVHAAAETPISVTLAPTKDNTLYESADGSLGNGAGQNFFAGRTFQVSGSVRRGLIAFDVAGSIPAGSTIQATTFTLHMSRTRPGSHPVALHRLLADWGEGTSDAFGGGGIGQTGEGGGTPATAGDATWKHTFSNTFTWGALGGDFSVTTSASTSVGGTGTYTWTSVQMAADVQGWLDNPSTNFGWLLQGNESQGGTAKRFDSRENPTAANRPTLVVQFTPPPVVSIGDAQVDESAGNATLLLTLDKAATSSATVTYATSDGTATAPADYTATSTTLTIEAGVTSTTIFIPIVSDSIDELDESFAVSLATSTGVTISDTAGAATVTVLDDDPPPSVTAVAAVSIAEGVANTTTTVDTTVSLSAVSGLPVSVKYDTADGTAISPGDYIGVTGGMVTVPAGNVTATISVTVLGDNTFEPDETFTLILTAATTTSTTTPLTIAQATTTVTVVNDDPVFQLPGLGQLGLVLLAGLLAATLFWNWRPIIAVTPRSRMQYATSSTAWG